MLTLSPAWLRDVWSLSINKEEKPFLLYLLFLSAPAEICYGATLSVGTSRSWKTFLCCSQGLVELDLDANLTNGESVEQPEG